MTIPKAKLFCQPRGLNQAIDQMECINQVVSCSVAWTTVVFNIIVLPVSHSSFQRQRTPAVDFSAKLAANG